jgi:hypothetical protein
VGHLWPVFAGKNGAEASDLGPAHNLPAHFADRDMAISWMFTDMYGISHNFWGMNIHKPNNLG